MSLVSTLWNLFKKAGITGNFVQDVSVWVHQSRLVCTLTFCRQEMVMNIYLSLSCLIYQ